MELALALRALFALGAVLGLVGLVAALIRRFKLLPGLADPRAERRLGLVESLTLDARRRLIVVRRDGAHHLLLLGPAGDRLIESYLASEEGATANVLPFERGRKPPGADTQ